MRSSTKDALWVGWILFGFAGTIASWACGEKKPPCTPESRQALIALYDEASGRVISSGQCDKVQRIEDCAAYRVVEEHFHIAERGLCK